MPAPRPSISATAPARTGWAASSSVEPTSQATNTAMPPPRSAASAAGFCCSTLQNTHTVSAPQAAAIAAGSQRAAGPEDEVDGDPDDRRDETEQDELAQRRQRREREPAREVHADREGGDHREPAEPRPAQDRNDDQADDERCDTPLDRGIAEELFHGSPSAIADGDHTLREQPSAAGYFAGAPRRYGYSRGTVSANDGRSKSFAARRARFGRSPRQSSSRKRKSSQPRQQPAATSASVKPGPVQNARLPSWRSIASRPRSTLTFWRSIHDGLRSPA